MVLLPKKYNNCLEESWRDVNVCDHLLDDLFSLNVVPIFSKGECNNILWGPAVDVYDENDAIIVEADLPGLEKKNLKVTLQENVLILSGKVARKAKSKDAHTIRSERCYGTFTRAIPIKADINAQKVRAQYNDGVLRVTLPKSETAKPKKIDIALN